MPTLHQAVMQRLRHMGEGATAPPAGAGNADWLCRTERCLTALAKRHRVRRILGGEVLANDRTYLIKLWSYEAETADLVTAQGNCEDCGESALADAVAATAGRLFDRPLPPSVATAAPPPVPTLAPAVPRESPAAREPSSAPHAAPPWTARRRVIGAGVLGGVAAVTLIPAIITSVVDGRTYGSCTRPVNEVGTCAYDFTWLYGTGYALSAAALAGVALLLTIPLARSAPNREAP